MKIGSILEVFRVFVYTNYSGDFSKIGWLLCDEIDSCMICTKRLFNKTHCYSCGNILCSNCNDHLALVKSLEILGQVNVCKLCYYEQVI